MKKSEVRIISGEDIVQSVDMVEAIDAMEEAYRQVSSGKAEMPVRTNLPVAEHDGSALFMPAYMSSLSRLSVKSVMTFSRNHEKGLPAIHALVQLFNAETGEPLSLLDGETLTALRTGAASGAATRLLSRSNADSVAIIGAGVQGKTQLEAVGSVRNIQKAYVIDVSTTAAEQFAKEMSKKIGITVQPAGVENLREVDIICTATGAKTPVFADEQLKEGVHINGIGSFRPDMCEIPSETIKKARVFVDHFESCRKEAGDLLQPLEKGIITEDHFRCELGDALVDSGKGRQNELEVTFFKSVGIAVQDLLLASLVYDRALENGRGVTVHL